MAARTRKTATTTATARTEASDLSFQNFLVELGLLCAKYQDAVAPAETAADDADDDAEEDAPATPARRTRGKAGAKTTAPAPEADEDDDADEEEAPSFTRAQLEKKTIAALRKLLSATGEYADEDVAEADKETAIAALLGELPDDEDDEDADDDEAEDDAEDSEEDEDDLRAEYEELSLAELRKKARDEYDATPTEIKGLKKDELIDYMLNPEEDDDSVDDEDDEEGYSEEELLAMSPAELDKIAEEWELDVEDVVVPKRLVGAAKKTYVAELAALILDAQE